MSASTAIAASTSSMTMFRRFSRCSAAEKFFIQGFRNRSLREHLAFLDGVGDLRECLEARVLDRRWQRGTGCSGRWLPGDGGQIRKKRVDGLLQISELHDPLTVALFHHAVETTTPRAVGMPVSTIEAGIRNLKSVRGIGITGSAGKTTTKEMIATLIATERRTHRSWGNFNNQIGAVERRRRRWWSSPLEECNRACGTS
jgi:hypothetical protein